MSARLACGVVALVTIIAAGIPGPSLGSHGGLIEGIVIDFEGLQPVRDGAAGPACVVDGSVHNASGRVVTVRVRYRAVDGVGQVAVAAARIVRVVPGETRSFASSPFVGDRGTGVGCAALRTVHMVEAAADPVEP